MNFPGLDSGWTFFHRALRGSGWIRPWNLDRSKQSLADGNGVLVVATTALGDTLLCTPLLETLSKALGPKRVGFLVRENYAELYQNDPRIGQVFTVPGKFRGFSALKKNLNTAPIRFHVALIANCTEPDLIPQLWWCGLRGFLRYRSRWSVWHNWFANDNMLRRPGESDYATGHAIENNLAMAEALDLPIVSKHLSVYVPKDVSMPVAKERLVLLHPGASRAEKKWPVKNWRAVAIALAKSHDCRFAITCSASEQPLAAELTAQLPQPVENLAGKLNLVELAARQKSAALFLSGDTGPYHLAVAVNCPTVTLFAPRDRGSSMEACGPYQVDQHRHQALQTKHFGDSIETISPQNVITAASSVLKASA